MLQQKVIQEEQVTFRDQNTFVKLNSPVPVLILISIFWVNPRNITSNELGEWTTTVDNFTRSMLLSTLEEKKTPIILRKHTQVAKCFSSEAAVKLVFLLNFDFF